MSFKMMTSLNDHIRLNHKHVMAMLCPTTTLARLRINRFPSSHTIFHFAEPLPTRIPHQNIENSPGRFYIRFCLSQCTIEAQSALQNWCHQSAIFKKPCYLIDFFLLSNGFPTDVARPMWLILQLKLGGSVPACIGLPRRLLIKLPNCLTQLESSRWDQMLNAAHAPFQNLSTMISLCIVVIGDKIKIILVPPIGPLFLINRNNSIMGEVLTKNNYR